MDGVVKLSRKKSDYFDLMRKPTEQYVDNELKEKYAIFRRKSELKKPYLEDAFPEMEYQDYDWPNIKPYWPDYPPITDEIQSGGTKYPIGDLEELETHTGCPVMLWCDPTNPDEITPGDEILMCFEGFCSKNISIKLLEVSADGFSLGKIYIFGGTKWYPPIRACAMLSASSTCEGTAYVEACDKDYAYSSLTYAGTNRPYPNPAAWITCTVRAECDCETKPDVAYDDDNSDDTIDRNGTATIVVKDGCPPFSWSVSGTGFSIPASSEGRTNILSADDTACGTATITVTDHCGDSCSGYVRGTEGQWVLKSIGTCVISGVGTFTGTTGTPERYCYEYIVGNKKQTQETKYEATGNYSGPCPAGGACLDYCSGAACEECVGNGDHPIPCEDAPTEELPHRIICWSNYNLYYFEWEC